MKVYRIHKASILSVSIAVLGSLGIGALLGSFLFPALILLVFFLGKMWLLPKILRPKS
jgi:hypothetical protein